MTVGSTDSLSARRYDATCPWNPVPSISFVFSIRHDRFSFLFSCSFICYLMEGLPTWKARPLCLSSQWHHPSGYTWELVSLKWNAACLGEKNTFRIPVVEEIYYYYYFNQKPCLDLKRLGGNIRGSEAWSLTGNRRFAFVIPNTA